MTDEPTILIRDLIAAGVEASLIARVSVLAARVADLDRRRAADADRQRRRRSNDDHVTSRVSRDSPDVTPRAYTSPQDSSKPKKVSRSACELPADWFSIECLNFAEAKGWPREKIDAEAQRFADHARAKGRKARDWLAAWRNWVTSPYQQPQAASGNGQTPRPGSKEDNRERTHHALRKLREYVVVNADDQGGSSSTRGPNAGLLPFAKPA